MNNAVEIRKDGTVKFVKISETKKEKSPALAILIA